MAPITEMQQKMQKIEALLVDVESIEDEKTRSRVLELIQSLMNLHAAGLDRIVEIASAAGDPGLALIDQLGRDPLIAPLLLLYGLHPVDFETRVAQALEKVRPYLQSHGGNIELVGLQDCVVRLRLHGSCHGCSSSTLTLKSVVEEAIYESAPDVCGIEVDDSTEAVTPGFVPLETVGTGAGSRRGNEPLKIIN